MPSKVKQKGRPAPVEEIEIVPPRFRSAVVWTILLAMFWAFSFVRVSFASSANDLGRHLRDGELLLGHTTAILHHNFYSYAHPDFPFLNHHWLTTIIFYLAFHLFGAAGLNVLYVALGTVAFALLFRIAEREAGIATAGVIAALAMPFLALRSGIRPEVFSILLLAIFFTICWNVYRERMPPKTLWILPAIEVVWVNLHPGFALGPVLIGVFLIYEILAKRRNLPTLGISLALCVIAGLANPNGVRGLLFPLTVSENYAMPVRENYSVALLPHVPLATMLEIAVPLLLVMALAAIRRNIDPEWPLAAFAIASGVMSLLFFRVYVFFGFFLVLSLCVLMRKFFAKGTPGWLIAMLATVAILNGGYILSLQWDKTGIGLNRGDDELAQFMIDNRIRGRVFNGYGSGGYLIHYLPDQKIYIDSRPEAYPAAFIRDDYLAPLRDEDAWKRANAKYHFDAICFVQFDENEGKFLIRRIRDPEWALVASGSYILLVRRTPQFADVIARHEMRLR